MRVRTHNAGVYLIAPKGSEDVLLLKQRLDFREPLMLDMSHYISDDETANFQAISMLQQSEQTFPNAQAVDVVLLGLPTVGKTTMLSLLITGKMNTHMSTAEVCFLSLRIDAHETRFCSSVASCKSSHGSWSLVLAVRFLLKEV